MSVGRGLIRRMAVPLRSAFSLVGAFTVCDKVPLKGFASSARLSRPAVAGLYRPIVFANCPELRAVQLLVAWGQVVAMQSRYSSKSAQILPIGWYARATLISSHAPHCQGSLLECIRTWDRLPAGARGNSYIVVRTDDQRESVLRPKELENYIRDPKFLSL